MTETVERINIGGRFPDGSPVYLTPWTFEVPQIRDEINEHLSGRILNACAGKTRVEHDGPVVRNDIDPARDADLHVDVRDIDRAVEPESFDTVLFDPPYDADNADKHYNGHHIGRPWEPRDALEAVTAPGGVVVGFGWNSDGFDGYDGWRRERTVYFRTPNMNGADVCMTVDRKVEGNS